MPAINVSNVVQSLAASPVTRRRFAAGSYPQAGATRGQFVAGASADTTIRAVMQPIDDRTRQLLPEGIRLRARYLLHTTADVRGDAPATGASITQADDVIYNGRTYTVWQDRDWATHGSYTRCVLLDRSAEP